MKKPVKGASAATTPEIGFGAESSNAVLVKLSPLPPRLLLSRTRVPLGLISVTSRSPTKVCVILMFTFTSSTIGEVAPATAKVSVTTPVAGIARAGALVKVCAAMSMNGLNKPESVSNCAEML